MEDAAKRNVVSDRWGTASQGRRKQKLSDVSGYRQSSAELPAGGRKNGRNLWVTAEKYPWRMGISNLPVKEDTSLGHWLSAAALEYARTGDRELLGKAEYIVDELALCQKDNGGQWAASIPEKYFRWIGLGKNVWAPHYTVHKTFMGLIDVYLYGHYEKALEVADQFADWFVEYSGKYTREEFDDILDFETGGMLEISGTAS